MFRTVYPHLVSLAKHCQFQQCRPTIKTAVQNTRTLSGGSTITHHNLEKPPIVKAIIEVAGDCGVPSFIVEPVLDRNPDLLKCSPKKWSCVLKQLLEYGFIVDDVLNMLSECPEILQMKEEKLWNSLLAWQECQFGEDLLLTLLSCHPKLIIAEKVDIITRVTKLSQYFEGRRRVAKAIGVAPSIFYENWNSLFKKLEYLHTLRTDASDILSTGVLKFDLRFIKMRHEFLYRAGLYKMPTKHYKKSLDKNTKLNKIVNTPDEMFAVHVAGLSLFEYETFSDMYDAECEDDDYYDSDSDVD